MKLLSKLNVIFILGLACVIVHGAEEVCSSVEPCVSPIQICVEAAEGNSSVCDTKSLFADFRADVDLGLPAIVFAACFVSAGAGMGGGGMLVPLFSISLNSAHLAVPLAKAAVVGSSIGTRNRDVESLSMTKGTL